MFAHLSSLLVSGRTASEPARARGRAHDREGLPEQDHRVGARHQCVDGFHTSPPHLRKARSDVAGSDGHHDLQARQTLDRRRIARRERLLDAIVDDRFTRASPPVADDRRRDRGDRAGCKRRDDRDAETIASSERRQQQQAGDDQAQPLQGLHRRSSTSPALRRSTHGQIERSLRLDHNRTLITHGSPLFLLLPSQIHDDIPRCRTPSSVQMSSQLRRQPRVQSRAPLWFDAKDVRDLKSSAAPTSSSPYRARGFQAR